MTIASPAVTYIGVLFGGIVHVVVVVVAFVVAAFVVVLLRTDSFAILTDPLVCYFSIMQ